MAWIYLIAAGILETLWAVAMKASNGFTLLIPSLITVLAMIGSVALLALAMRTLPLGTAYVVWTGIGAVGAFAAGVVMFGESLSLMRVTAAGCRPDHDEGLGVKNGGCPLQAQARYPAGVVVPHRCCGS